MKKVVVIIIVVVILGTAFFLLNRSQSIETSIKTSPSGTSDTFHPDPSNATFIIDDESITLSAGKNDESVAPSSSAVEETATLDKFAYGDVNADGKTDTVLFLARFGAGSGTFIYLAGFISGPVSYKGSQTFFLGDRIAVQSVVMEKGVVTVKYLDRKTDEAFSAEPTVLVTKQFVYRTGEFQER